MTTWQVVELARGHHWRHGWIPITPEAHAIKDKKKSGHATDKPSGAVAVKGKPRIEETRHGKRITLRTYVGTEDVGHMHLEPAEGKSGTYVIDHVRVKHEHRGKGLATQMLRHARKDRTVIHSDDLTEHGAVWRAKMEKLEKPKGTSYEAAIKSDSLLPPALRNPNLHGGEENHRKAVAAYLEKNPGGWKAAQATQSAHVAETKAARPSKKPAKAKPKTAPKSASTADANSLRHMTPHQAVLWEEANGNDPGARGVDAALGIRGEWEKADSAPKPDEELNEAMEVWQFGADEGSGMEFYQLLNQARRSGKPDALDRMTEELDLDTSLAGLDEVMQRRLAESRASRDLTLFRGIQHGGEFGVGDVLTDPGWAATSYNPTVANMFNQAANGKTLVVHAPKGTPILRVPDPMEHEILFGPDTPMRVTRVNGNEIHVIVEPTR